MSNKIVPQTYRTVIDDVISNISSEFDEYGVSEDVLGDLQARWESKIIASHVAEFEPDSKQPSNSTTPPSNTPTAPPSFPPPPPPPHPSQYPLTHPQQPYPPPPQPYQNSGPLPPISVKTEPGVEQSPQQQQRYPLTLGQAMQMQTFVLPNHATHHPGQGQPGGNESVLQFHQQQQPPRRADGQTAAVRQDPESNSSIPHHDGPSSTSSASSSTPPPGAGLLAASTTAPTVSTTAPTTSPVVTTVSTVASTASEEINSDLDDSDSDVDAAEEAEAAGPEQDIVFCTYDKVARVKNKWKCVLKDGMVHVNGKDYLFAKCTGEFEW